MDDNKKENTLKLNHSSKLTLHMPASDGKLLSNNMPKNSSVVARNNTVTVVNKKRVFAKDQENNTDSLLKASFKQEINKDFHSSKTSLTVSEQNKRLEVLKQQAAQQKQFNEAKESEILNNSKLEDFVDTSNVDSDKIDSELKLDDIIKNNQDIDAPNAEIKITQEISKSEIKSETFDDDFEDKKNKNKLKSKIEVKPTKNKFLEEKRGVSRINLQKILSGDEEERTRSFASIKRSREKAKRNAGKFDISNQEKMVREVILPEIIVVQELANRMSERVTDVIKELMKMGMIATANQTIDADIAELVSEALGHKVKRVSESDIENILNLGKDDDNSLVNRAPVVTVMGHVDHGKTSLLDAIRSTDIVEGEAGGITQHIGAYRIKTQKGDFITFIDTPGHEAFTSMRSRGAQATDIVVLVVAADDGIKEQTIEAINHAKAALVPIIVAVNKIDKPNSDPSKVRTELLQYELVAEEFGGDVMIVDVSAKSKLNIDKLEDAILLQAEMLELKSNPNRKASGVVIESRMDKARGIIATVLVQNGTLRVGDMVIAGVAFGRVKIQIDDKGNKIMEATPSVPVEILGLTVAPQAGDRFDVVDSEKQARDIAEYREKRFRTIKSTHNHRGSLEELFSKASNEGKIKELSMIIKGDVQGSIEAIIGSIKKLENDEIKVKIIHTGVGGITESDIALANASNSIIVGFNVRAGNQATTMAQNENIILRYYSIIYNLIDDIKAIMSGMLDPTIREEYIGSADIRKIFSVSKIGKIAGCFVTKGVVKRGAGIRLLRDNVVIYDGKLKTLRRFQDDAKEVRENFECGIALENFDDIKLNDKLEVYELIEEKKSL